MTNEAQNPDDKIGENTDVLAFTHLDLI